METGSKRVYTALEDIASYAMQPIQTIVSNEAPGLPWDEPIGILAFKAFPEFNPQQQVVSLIDATDAIEQPTKLLILWDRIDE